MHGGANRAKQGQGEIQKNGLVIGFRKILHGNPMVDEDSALSVFVP